MSKTRDFFVCFTVRDRFQVGHRYQNTPPTEPVAWCEHAEEAHEIARKFNAILADNDKAHAESLPILSERNRTTQVFPTQGDLRVRREPSSRCRHLGVINDPDFVHGGWLVMAAAGEFVLEIKMLALESARDTERRFLAGSDRNAEEILAERIEDLSAAEAQQ